MGPLAGVRVIEIAGIGPAPFCGMMLADMGADVLRIDRVVPAESVGVTPPLDVLNRGRRSAALDLKHPQGAATLLDLVERADALIEGFRPGVVERLGVGPDECLARNPKLVYGRMTGWGQSGPIAAAAGHDLNYIALSGVLGSIGRQDHAPVPPLNLVGDFGGGGMLLAFGVVSGILRARSDGTGQVIDASMVDGSALLAAWFAGARAMGLWRDERGANVLDTGAPYYDVYECADGEFVAIAAIEPHFWAELLERIGLAASELPAQNDRTRWPELRARLAEVFSGRTRDEWTTLLEGTDACFAPVLSMAEAPSHPHNVARGTFVEAFGIEQPAPAPRFGATPGSIDRPPPQPGEHTDEALADWGISAERRALLRNAGAIGVASEG
jgi:alpha-methylacyl-CoA racemase